MSCILQMFFVLMECLLRKINRGTINKRYRIANAKGPPANSGTPWMVVVDVPCETEHVEIVVGTV